MLLVYSGFMSNGDDLWEIMEFIYLNDNEPVTVYDLVRETGQIKGRINRLLYSNQREPSVFQTRGTRTGSQQPLWNLTSGGYQVVDKIYQKKDVVEFESVDKTGLFCRVCNNLVVTSYCENPICKENPVPIGATVVHGEITGGEGKSILKLFDYSAGKESSREEREFAIRETFNAIFWVPEGAKNEDYVKSFGDSKSQTRCHRLIELLQGFNVPNYLNSREEDIEYIRSICSTC